MEIEQVKKVFDTSTYKEQDSIQMIERVFTEHNLDQTTDSILKNVTTKSVVLAPYNSSRSNAGLDSVSNISVYSRHNKIIQMKGGKLKEIDREYEANNNENMDNGVFNTEEEKSRMTRDSVVMRSIEVGSGNMEN